MAFRPSTVLASSHLAWFSEHVLPWRRHSYRHTPSRTAVAWYACVLAMYLESRRARARARRSVGPHAHCPMRPAPPRAGAPLVRVVLLPDSRVEAAGGGGRKESARPLAGGGRGRSDGADPTCAPTYLLHARLADAKKLDALVDELAGGGDGAGDGLRLPSMLRWRPTKLGAETPADVALTKPTSDSMRALYRWKFPLTSATVELG